MHVRVDQTRKDVQPVGVYFVTARADLTDADDDPGVDGEIDRHHPVRCDDQAAPDD